MTNHVHLLIHEKEEPVAKTMQRIATRYAWWYNQKYERSGHVFQGRYGSECVEDDEYLLTVIRYIHNNPVKAGIVTQPEDFVGAVSMHIMAGTSIRPDSPIQVLY